MSDSDSDGDSDSDDGHPTAAHLIAALLGNEVAAWPHQSAAASTMAQQLRSMRQSALEGPTSARERSTLREAAGSDCAAQIAALLATDCAQTCAQLRELSWDARDISLPPEVLTTIAEATCAGRFASYASGQARRALCCCIECPTDDAETLSTAAHVEAASHHKSLHWRASAAGTRRLELVCADCGKLTAFACVPRVEPRPGDGWHEVTAAILRNSSSPVALSVLSTLPSDSPRGFDSHRCSFARPMCTRARQASRVAATSTSSPPPRSCRQRLPRTLSAHMCAQICEAACATA